MSRTRKRVDLGRLVNNILNASAILEKLNFKDHIQGMFSDTTQINTNLVRA